MRLRKYTGYDFTSDNIAMVYYLGKAYQRIYYKGYCTTTSLQNDNIMKSFGYRMDWRHIKFHI